MAPTSPSPFRRSESHQRSQTPYQTAQTILPSIERADDALSSSSSATCSGGEQTESPPRPIHSPLTPLSTSKSKPTSSAPASAPTTNDAPSKAPALAPPPWQSDDNLAAQTVLPPIDQASDKSISSKPRERKKHKLVLRASYDSDLYDPQYPSDVRTYHAEGAAAAIAEMDAEGLPDTSSSDFLSLESGNESEESGDWSEGSDDFMYPQELAVPDHAHCCPDADVPLPSMEGPTRRDREVAASKVRKYLSRWELSDEEEGDDDENENENLGMRTRARARAQVQAQAQARSQARAQESQEEKCYDFKIELYMHEREGWLKGTEDIDSTTTQHPHSIAHALSSEEVERWDLLTSARRWVEVRLDKHVRAGMDVGERSLVRRDKALKVIAKWIEGESGGLWVWVDRREVRVFVTPLGDGDEDEDEDDDEDRNRWGMYVLPAEYDASRPRERVELMSLDKRKREESDEGESDDDERLRQESPCGSVWRRRYRALPKKAEKG